MTDKGNRLSLKYRMIYYIGGILFATVSYIFGICAYGFESAQVGDIKFYNSLIRNLFDSFDAHWLSFFVWEVICTAISLTIGYLFDREFYYRQKAEERANVDGLTGLYNHRYFQERLNAEISRASRYDRALSIIILDLDDFKTFNDTWGHQEGDKLLTLFAALCAQCVRTIDVVARYGGEEFIIILPETSAEDALDAAERIVECTRKQTIAAFGKNRGITVSAGVASYPMHGTNRHSIILNADAALYYAKQRGKDRCYIYEQEHHKPFRAASTHVVSNYAIEDEDIEAIGALGASIDEKEMSSRGHSHSVMEMSTALGAKIGMSAEEIGNLCVAALLHDIGKIGTPQSILGKTDPLEVDEMKQIQNHAGIGSRILKRVQQMGSIGPGVKHHHERFDGTGYPNGLSGHNIPLLARVIAVADSYDAMISDRPYRPALKREDAIEELKKCAGTQFDPDIVDAFINLLEETAELEDESQAA